MKGMQRALYAFLLVFTFLLVQAGLLAHAVSHVAPISHAGDEGLPADAPCELCVGYAQLSGSAPLPENLLLPVCLARHEAPQQLVSVLVTRHAFHSRARAPPVFF